MRNVAQDRLQEQDKANPLVPTMPDFIAFIIHPDQVGIRRRADPGMRHVVSDATG